MKKNNYRLITIITYILISLLAFSMTTNYIIKKEKELLQKSYVALSDNLQDKIDSLIQKKKNATLALTITLANNSDVKEIIDKKYYDSKKLHELSLTLRRETDFKNVWFQVLDKNGISLFRSWSKKRGDDLSKVRNDVVDMIAKPKIKSTISVGRYDMTFKAMVPIFEDGKFAGVIESITHFNSISRGLRTSDFIEPVIVVEEKFTKQLTHPFTKLFVQNHYVANISADKKIMKYMEKIGVKKLLETDDILVDDRFLISKHPIYFDHKKLATFVVFKELDLINTSSIEDYRKNAFFYLGLFIVLLGLILYIISYYLYSKQITKLIAELNQNQSDLKRLNQNLKETVNKEVEKNDRKNKILFHQSKLAAMGEMIENIAHQWRQPLSIISTAASGIKIKKELGVEITSKEEIEILDSIVSTSKYLSTTIDDFRYFFSKDKSKSVFDIKVLLEKAIGIQKSDLTSKNINLIEKFDSFEIKTYESELLQVILNILNNAKDELSRRNISNRLILLETYKNDGYLNIVIHDNAGGIEPHIIDRVFEPYFTTKHKNQGTGIGLYMSQEIVSKHMKGSLHVLNSYLEYENKSFKGAKFTITIPLLEN